MHKRGDDSADSGFKESKEADIFETCTRIEAEREPRGRLLSDLLFCLLS